MARALFIAILKTSWGSGRRTGGESVTYQQNTQISILEQKEGIIQILSKCHVGRLDLLLAPLLLEPAPLSLVHQHVQLKVGFLAEPGATLFTGQLDTLLGGQLVSLVQEFYARY